MTIMMTLFSSILLYLNHANIHIMVVFAFFQDQYYKLATKFVNLNYLCSVIISTNLQWLLVCGRLSPTSDAMEYCWYTKGKCKVLCPSIHSVPSSDSESHTLDLYSD